LRLYIIASKNNVNNFNLDVKLKPTDSIGDAKQKIQALKGVPVNRHALIYAQIEQMDDKKTFADYEIQEQTFIRLNVLESVAKSSSKTQAEIHLEPTLVQRNTRSQNSKSTLSPLLYREILIAKIHNHTRNCNSRLMR
jgi:hypothetical protein